MFFEVTVDFGLLLYLVLNKSENPGWSVASVGEDFTYCFYWSFYLIDPNCELSSFLSLKKSMLNLTLEGLSMKCMFTGYTLSCVLFRIDIGL